MTLWDPEIESPGASAPHWDRLPCSLHQGSSLTEQYSLRCIQVLVFWHFPLGLRPSRWYLFSPFFIASRLFRFEIVLSKIISRKAKTWRCANFCRRKFLEQNLHMTKGRKDLLLFVSLPERYVEVLDDRGVVSVALKGIWQSIVRECSTHRKKGDCLVASKTR